MVFPEATKSGCIIISSDLASAYDITDNLKYSSVFPADNAEALTELLLHYTDNEELLEKIARKCKNLQSGSFTGR